MNTFAFTAEIPSQLNPIDKINARSYFTSNGSVFYQFGFVTTKWTFHIGYPIAKIKSNCKNHLYNNAKIAKF